MISFGQKIIKETYDAFYNYLRCRFILKSHTLQTGLSKGQWHEYEERVLHGLFNSFVHFCENEQGCFGTDRKPGREAAMAHFEWAAKLVWEEDECPAGSDKVGKLTSQALSAIEQRNLYLWWKDDRPIRKDPYTAPEQLESPDMSLGFKIGKWDMDLEKKYYDEDTEMLIRLIKIRNHLWT